MTPGARAELREGAPLPMEPRRVEALALAMALAPGVYARNRRFELFSRPGTQRARSRAATLRGIVRQLARATGLTVESASRGAGTVHVLRYRVVEMRMSRVVELSAAELSALRLLAARAGLPCLPPDEHDRTLVEETLTVLLDDLAPPGAVIGM